MNETEEHCRLHRHIRDSQRKSQVQRNRCAAAAKSGVARPRTIEKLRLHVYDGGDGTNQQHEEYGHENQHVDRRAGERRVARLGLLGHGDGASGGQCSGEATAELVATADWRFGPGRRWVETAASRQRRRRRISQAPSIRK